MACAEASLRRVDMSAMAKTFGLDGAPLDVTDDFL